MFNRSFDPYDKIIELNQRIIQLESAHNNLAMAFHQSEKDLNQALKLITDLQRRHVHFLNNVLKDYAKHGIPLDPHIDKPRAKR